MRIDATDPKDPEWKRFLFPCDCRESEYVHIGWWEDDDDPAYLEVIPAIWAPGWLERLKAIGRIIVGRPHYHGGILLNPEAVGQLRLTLDEFDRKRERQVNQDGKVKSEA